MFMQGHCEPPGLSEWQLVRDFDPAGKASGVDGDIIMKHKNI
jgi:hypothetical protein